MDMRFHWIQDRVKQGQFRVHWKRGTVNYADYHTKHHPPSHHIKMRPTHLQVATRAAHNQPQTKDSGEGVLIGPGTQISPETIARLNRMNAAARAQARARDRG